MIAYAILITFALGTVWGFLNPPSVDKSDTRTGSNPDLSTLRIATLAAFTVGFVLDICTGSFLFFAMTMFPTAYLSTLLGWSLWWNVRA